MVGSAEAFLKYNKDNVMKHLLAIEAHLRELEEGYRPDHASCVIKHILQLEEQCEEGISHAAELGQDEVAKIFKRVRDEAESIRKALLEGRPPAEIIRMVRAVRRVAEKLDPSFELEKCTTCTVDLGKVKAGHEGSGDLRKMEEEYADKVLSYLSEKYGVRKPKLVLLDKCPGEPADFGLYVKDRKEIVLCRGGVDVHKLAHEFAHYLQDVRKADVDWEEGECEAESFALNVVRGREAGQGHGEVARDVPASVAAAVLVAGVLVNLALLLARK